MSGYKRLTENKALKVGTYIGEFATPGMGPMLKEAGAEFAFVDMEHSAFNFETAKALLRSLHDHHIATVLRVPSKLPHHLGLACDIGAQGVMLPMLATQAEAKAGVDAIKYPPLGKRGCAFAIAHDDYAPGPVLETMEAANGKITLVPLIETADGVENCEAIAATDGVDCIWVGHFDLSASLGIPAQFDHPGFVAAEKRIMDAAKANGKSLGRLATSVDECRALHARGYDFICYSGDIWLYQSALREGFAAIRAQGDA